MHQLRHGGTVVRNARNPSSKIFFRIPLLSTTKYVSKNDDKITDVPWGPFYTPPNKRPKPLPPRKEPEQPRVYQYDPFDPRLNPDVHRRQPAGKDDANPGLD